MTITLTPDQQSWILQQIAQGEFTSVDDAARQLIAERIAEREAEAADFTWAKPYVDFALAEVERGEIVSADNFRGHIKSVLTRLAR